MSWHTIKRRKVDIMFADYIKKKAKFCCEKCGKLCKVGDEWVAQLDASHYFSRRKENVRHDSRNVYALCSSCHRRMGGYTRDENGEYDLWVKAKLGNNEYQLLKWDANKYKKKDDKLTELYVRQLLKELDL